MQSSHVLVGSRTFAYQHGHIILGISMSSASLSLEFETIVAQERDSFSQVMDAYIRDGSVPQECVFTELSRRMTIIRNVSQCPHVYNGWKNLSALVETWSDRDMWELCVKKQKSEVAVLASRTTGGTCNGMLTFQRIGATDYMVCKVPFHCQKSAVGHHTMRTSVWSMLPRRSM